MEESVSAPPPTNGGVAQLQFVDIETQEGAGGESTGLDVKPPTSSAGSPSAGDGTPAPKPSLLSHLALGQVLGSEYSREDTPLIGKFAKSRRRKRDRELGIGRSDSFLERLKRGSTNSLHKSWRQYERSIDESPLLTKAVTSCVLVGFGNVASQCLGPRSPAGFSAADAGRFFLMGAVLHAPVTHYYYHALDTALPPTRSPWTLTTLAKLFIDQAFFGPAFMLLVYWFLGLARGTAPGSICRQIREEYWGTMVVSWKLWVPATFVNMVVIRPQYRVLYCNVVFFVWSIILSFLLKVK